MQLGIVGFRHGDFSVHGLQRTIALMPVECFMIYIVSKVLMVMLMFTTYIVWNHPDYSERLKTRIAIITGISFIACLASELIFLFNDPLPMRMVVVDNKAMAYGITMIVVYGIIKAFAGICYWNSPKLERKLSQRTRHLIYLNLGSALCLARIMWFCPHTLNIGKV